jgi:hypothetical protein
MVARRAAVNAQPQAPASRRLASQLSLPQSASMRRSPPSTPTAARWLAGWLADQACCPPPPAALRRQRGGQHDLAQRRPVHPCQQAAPALQVCGQRPPLLPQHPAPHLGQPEPRVPRDPGRRVRACAGGTNAARMPTCSDGTRSWMHARCLHPSMVLPSPAASALQVCRQAACSSQLCLPCRLIECEFEPTPDSSDTGCVGKGGKGGIGLQHFLLLPKHP